MEAILRDFPEEFESERLLIRAPRFHDGKHVNEAVLESFAELQRWMPWAKSKPSLEESETYLRSARAKFIAREDLQLLLFLKESGQFIGSSGLHRINWEVPRFEIGYWCRTACTGRGYISEAVYRIAVFAFEELDAKRIEIRADALNEKSCRIPERLGFTLEGVLRNDCLDEAGDLRDTRIYSVISREELKQ